ncbi:MAG: hypothetical protein M3Z54_12095 [Gemmatimonadota bacterium]|nr:hypothetical protein [Gemmatimonadota bacterium]
MNSSPDFEHAIVDQTKVIEYLLGSSGPASIAKARFYGSLGFAVDHWEELARALRAHAQRATVNTIATGWQQTRRKG